MSTSLARSLTLALAACLAGLPTVAQTVSAEDSSFLKQAAENGQAEIEASRLAQDKAQGEPVKTFARQMIEDHTRSAEELKTVAVGKGVNLPAKPSPQQKARIEALSGVDGAGFDQAYAEQFGVAAHEEAVSLFRKGTRAKDPDVKAFASKTLPTLEHHLEMARQLHSSVKAQR
jgi:putative membrane protein